jgi:hypothetical protein
MGDGNLEPVATATNKRRASQTRAQPKLISPAKVIPPTAREEL